MCTRLNNIFNIIIKGISETAIVSISGTIFIFLFAEVDSHILINRIMFLSLANYLCAYALYYYIFKEVNVNNKKKYTFILIAIFISLVSSYITSMGLKVVTFIIYLIIWYKSIVSITDERDFQSAKKVFMVSLLFYLFIILILSLLNGESVAIQNLKVFFSIYIGATLSYFATANLEKAYNKKNSNSLNKAKNIKIINLISNLLVLSFLVSTLTGFFGILEKIVFSNIANYFGIIIQKIIEIILYPIVILTTKLVELIFSRTDFSILEQLNKGNTPEYIEEIVNETLSPKSQAIIETVFSIAKWGIVILIIFIVSFYIIKAISNRALSKNEEDDKEEKEFILSSKDIERRMKKSLKKLANVVSALFSKSKDNSLELPRIRRIYIDTILTLKEKGYEFKKHYTPNEYLSTLAESKYINAGINDLTKVYNGCRYGKKEVTEEEIEESIRIKSNIYEISKEK